MKNKFVSLLLAALFIVALAGEATHVKAQEVCRDGIIWIDRWGCNPPPSCTIDCPEFAATTAAASEGSEWDALVVLVTEIVAFIIP